jgi:hypothetical protein
MERIWGDRSVKLMDAMRAKARANVKKIVFPEGDEPRTKEAAEILLVPAFSGMGPV